MALDYPAPLTDAVDHRFLLNREVFAPDGFTVTAGTAVVLLVEGAQHSTVMVAPPHLNVGAPFDVANEHLAYEGPGLPHHDPTPVGEEAALTGTVAAAALANLVPIPLLKALVYVESRWSSTAVSPTGPVGLMQFARATALECGLTVSGGVDERLDPAKAAPAGAGYLRRMYERFPEATNGFERWRFALAAYNQGRGAVNDAIRTVMAATGLATWPSAGSLSWLEVAGRWANAEGTRYVRTILAESGGPGGVAADRYGYGR